MSYHPRIQSLKQSPVGFCDCSCLKDLAALGDETTLRSFMAEVGWNGGWDGLVVWCLGTKDATKRCTNNTTKRWTLERGRMKLPGSRGKKNKYDVNDEFGKGSIHRTTWNDSGVWNYSTGVQFGSQPPASTKFGSSGHPVETWKPPLQDPRNASLEDLSSHFSSMISIWVLSHPKCCETLHHFECFCRKKSISS